MAHITQVGVIRVSDTRIIDQKGEEFFGHLDPCVCVQQSVQHCTPARHTVQCTQPFDNTTNTII